MSRRSSNMAHCVRAMMCNHEIAYKNIFTPFIRSYPLGNTIILCSSIKTSLITVCDSLFVLQVRYTTSLEYPSTPPWTTNRQRIRPSICHRLLAPLTEYVRRVTAWCHLRDLRKGSVLSIIMLSLIRYLCTTTLLCHFQEALEHDLANIGMLLLNLANHDIQLRVANICVLVDVHIGVLQPPPNRAPTYSKNGGNFFPSITWSSKEFYMFNKWWSTHALGQMNNSTPSSNRWDGTIFKSIHNSP